MKRTLAILLCLVLGLSSSVALASEASGIAEKQVYRRAYADEVETCLLYTSDAADDLLCVDLGGRRIIKKKKQNRETHEPYTSHNTINSRTYSTEIQTPRNTQQVKRH